MRKEELEHLNYLINKLKTREKELTKDKGSFISSEVYNITTNDGHHIRREKLLKGGKDGSAVIIVPFVDNDKVILCVEPRVFTKRTVGIGFPAGYIEGNEKGIIAAQRELYEETGLQGDLTYLGGFYQDSGISSAYNQIFVGENLQGNGVQHLDTDEYIYKFITDFNNLDYLLENDYINDCNALIAINKVKQYRRERKLWKNLMPKKLQKE